MRERLTDRISIDFHFGGQAWDDILHAQGMNAALHAQGREWVARLNADLHAAQAKRKQPIEDGYKYEITTGGTRDRLYVFPFTARAIAHEAVNQSMLKVVPVGSIKEGFGPQPEVPRELARRSLEAQGGRIGGQK